MPKDADIVLASGASYWVAIQVYCVFEEVDSPTAHLRADQDRLGWVLVEATERARPLKPAADGGEVSTAAGQRLGIVHE